jgi:AraC-like DNA-binding protein
MPVMYRADQVATVFCGQAAVDGCLASDRAWLARRARTVGARPEEVLDAYAQLPRTSEEKLLKIGKLLFLALSHLAETEGRVGLERTFALYRHRPVREAIAFIDEHFREPIGVREAAHHCGLAPAYLSRLFHKVAGLTFSDFLTRRRVEHAKELLRTTSMDMTAVALDAGYSHQSYFGRKFKQFTGKTPHQYRTQNRPHPPSPRPRRRGRGRT